MSPGGDMMTDCWILAVESHRRFSQVGITFEKEALMHIMHVHIHVKPECLDAFIQATLANARGSVREPGVARFDVIQQVDDPTRFMLIEVYRTEDAVAKHKETAHYAQWIATVPDMLAEPRTRTFYRNCFPDDAGWD